MSPLGRISLVLLVVALTLPPVLLVVLGSAPPPPIGGTTEVVDDTGSSTSAGRYRRIASVSTIADAILPDLVPSERVVSRTAWFAENHRLAFRLHGRPALVDARDTEAILALEPDLVVLSAFANERDAVTRLREAGLDVLDLGPMFGLATLVDDIRLLAATLGVPGRGELLARDLEARMARLARTVPGQERRRGLYLTVFDTQLAGGTRGSSYHDILTAAGLIDAGEAWLGEGVYAAWPTYRVEDLLSIDPDVIVTSTGRGRLLRALPGLERLRALNAPGGIIELPPGLLDATGPDMLRAAEALQVAVYRQ